MKALLSDTLCTKEKKKEKKGTLPNTYHSFLALHWESAIIFHYSQICQGSGKVAEKSLKKAVASRDHQCDADSVSSESEWAGRAIDCQMANESCVHAPLSI